MRKIRLFFDQLLILCLCNSVILWTVVQFSTAVKILIIIGLALFCFIYLISAGGRSDKNKKLSRIAKGSFLIDGAVISLPKFTNQNIDYIALGHIHKFRMEKLDYRCTWCYSGCLEGRGFDECGQKGFVLLNIEDGRVKADFIPNARRVIHAVDVPLDGSMNYKQIMQCIEERVGGISSEDIVQVNLTGEISEDTDIEVSSYESALAARFFYIRVENYCQNKIDYEKYENDVSLKGEFIRLVKNQTGLSDSEKTKIIMTGIKALAGRDF